MVEIRELSSELSDQIAAGEVIERPSSVVKELLENAIDAKSTKITITFLDAGLKEIMIEDNGIGISANQIDLAFRRHATSKISSKEDLFKIKTLGFRGEALASISAVARVEILTNTGTVEGTKATFSNGQKDSQEPAAAKKGTKITVRDLFYNTPARLKYLKSEKTEIAKIIDIVNRIAISYPDLSLTLKNGAKTILQTSGNGNLQQNIAQVYGRKVAADLIEFQGENADFKISGFISKPDFNRANRNYISLLLNGRYIKNFQLTRAITDGYGTSLPTGRYPLVVLNLIMDPLLVDVNVHPTKQEVRLSKEDTLSRLITNTIYEALHEKQAASSAVTGLENPTDQTDFDQLIFNLNKTNAEDISGPRDNQIISEPVADIEIKTTDPDQSLKTTTWAKNVQIQAQLYPFNSDNKSNANLESGNGQVLKAGFPDLVFKGQLQSGYLIADSSDGYYLIDIKAALEQINYDSLLQKLPELNLDQQALLTPLIFEFSQLEFLKLSNHLTELKKIGLDFEMFGQNSFVLHSHPTWLPKDDEHATILKILDLYLGSNNLDFPEFEKRVALLISKVNIKTMSQSFNEVTGQNLISDLAQTKNPYQSPKGQPTLVHFSLRDLDKMFKKIKR